MELCPPADGKGGAATEGLAYWELGLYAVGVALLLSEAATPGVGLAGLGGIACLLGCVEVAWELRDMCDMIAFSPTEVLAGGFVYETLVKNLMAASKPDLEAVCRDYFEMRDSMDGLYR